MPLDEMPLSSGNTSTGSATSFDSVIDTVST